MQNESRQILARELRPTSTRADSPHADGALIDNFGRRITYVRLSVTDRCNFRCRYCMPMHVDFLPKSEVLSLEDFLRLARVFVGMGVVKIRLTGGEPLARKNIVWLAEQISALPGLGELTMTTNGSELTRFAVPLARAGIRRLNISLDTLRAARFADLTRVGDFRKTMDGIEAARGAGFAKIKINVVMMRGFNDDELIDLVAYAVAREFDISFIEEMPLGDVGHARADTFFGAPDALAILTPAFGLAASDESSGGPARYWRIRGQRTRVGFITPHTNNFCAHCNRVRVNCVGELFPCLGQNDAIDLRPALRESDSDDALRARLLRAMAIKPKGHDFDLAQTEAKVVRFMSATGG